MSKMGKKRKKTIQKILRTFRIMLTQVDSENDRYFLSDIEWSFEEMHIY